MTSATFPAAERQLELTISALTRTVRRTLRSAEREEPAGTESGGVWAAVEHRCKLLREMMAAAAEFVKATQREVAPANQAETQPEPQAPAATPQAAAVELAATPDATATEPAQKPPVTLPTAAFMASYGSTRLADLPPLGDPNGPAPELDPRFRLAQLLSGRAVAIHDRPGQPDACRTAS